MVDPLQEDIEFLAHYGVKGMKWGVRKEYQPVKSSGGSAKKPELTEHEKKVLDAVGANEHTSDRMKRMFGPEEKAEKSGLSDRQKKMLIVGAGVVAAGLLAYGAHKYVQAKRMNEYLQDFDDIDLDYGLKVSALPEDFQVFMAEHQATSVTRMIEGLSPKDVAKFSDEPVNLSPGSVIKRISTEAESEIRPGGFFAAHKDEDVERYKAVLPIYWKQWGHDVEEGHVVSLKALEEIKAPSPKKTFEMFRGSLDDTVSHELFQPEPTTLRKLFKDAYGGKDDDEIARLAFPRQALAWADEDNFVTQHFFKKVKDQGYNALLDMNDMGSIGDAPLRVLKGSSFEIANVEKLTKDAISSAQESIMSLTHAFLGFMKDIRMKVIRERS